MTTALALIGTLFFIAGINAGIVHIVLTVLAWRGTLGDVSRRELGWTAVTGVAAFAICMAALAYSGNPGQPPVAAAAIPPQTVTLPVIAQTSTLPSYCSNPAASRLIECGWTPDKQHLLDAEAERKASADHLCDAPKSEIGFLLCQKVK